MTTYKQITMTIDDRGITSIFYFMNKFTLLQHWNSRKLGIKYFEIHIFTHSFIYLCILYLLYLIS